jgi:hypothetical protein
MYYYAYNKYTDRYKWGVLKRVNRKFLIKSAFPSDAIFPRLKIVFSLSCYFVFNLYIEERSFFSGTNNHIFSTRVMLEAYIWFITSQFFARNTIYSPVKLLVVVCFLNNKNASDFKLNSMKSTENKNNDEKIK